MTRSAASAQNGNLSSKSMPSGPTRGIMLEQRDEIMVRFDLVVMIWSVRARRVFEAVTSVGRGLLHQQNDLL
jgi:hypothetical protein